ncbi:universal stress protein [Flavobacterium psychrophilum]|uniref:universal stress protein n=2 Tax=Flavobacterium psychrophilum TaxID=96345 RepID=UPI000B8E8798|nr:universal stress protein [Flavobacterium psychrophilum]EKT3964769.1 universal stress protein [Flavobacterium psychrophilum]EKT4517604.1 universal stress protein [Flavobacterium psychrophilum]EKT4549599.1 universal stress protein [Flavobacterium psychrophilum]EKT4551095.1 universal stress protein [Flavobacterium psychrophilum]ELY1992330.1 universal stress protein [Flavobacterium psychrophilum]
MKDIKMNKVLIALDYNPTAQKIAEVGFSLAKSMNAEIILLHVLSAPVNYTTVYNPIMGFDGFVNLDIVEIDNEFLKKMALEFLENVKKHLGDTTISTIVKEGDYSEAILETANMQRADIIIVGNHNKKWLEKVLLGSTTQKILHDTNIPVLIVPTNKDL